MSDEGFLFIHDVTEVRICGHTEKWIRGGKILYQTTLSTAPLTHTDTYAG